MTARTVSAIANQDETLQRERQQSNMDEERAKSIVRQRQRWSDGTKQTIKVKRANDDVDDRDELDLYVYNTLIRKSHFFVLFCGGSNETEEFDDDRKRADETEEAPTLK
jgi:hypothetical protein